MRVIRFYSDCASTLTGRIAKVVNEDGNIDFMKFLLQSEKREDDCENSEKGDEDIESYQLWNIEDGLMHLMYLREGKIVSSFIDLHRHSIRVSISCGGDSRWKSHEVQMQSGSFSLVTEDNLPDTSPMTNEDKALDFWNRYFNLHDETAIDEYLSEPYIQHNPNVPDGVKAFRNEFHDRFFTDMKECSTIVMHVSSRDNLVFIHNILKRSPSVRGHAAVDIFRFKYGRIVEHWDVIQAMPATSKNDHPMF